MCKSPFVQLCVSKYKRLTKEETHVADYVFDESKNPRLVTNHKFSKYCSYNTMIMDFSKKNYSRLVFHVINSEVLCAYDGYGVTREQLQCLVGERFTDIPIRFMMMKKTKLH